MGDNVFAIEAKGITKCYNGINAVHNLNLQIPKGHIYGFVGPNGAGKTTTLKMITGLTNPTEGEIFINGVKVICGKADVLRVGFLPDVPGFYDWMRAPEFLMLCGKLLGVSNTDLPVMVDELLTLVGLKGVNTKIKGYSRGMKQRLGIAQALVNNPSVILLDEPVSALDPVGRKEVMDVVLSLKGRVTVIFSTHIISDVERVCDKVLIMNKGKILIDTDIHDLMTRSNSQFASLTVDGQPESIESLYGTLVEKEWVAMIERMTGNSFKIKLKENDKLSIELPKILTDLNLSIIKFERENSDLETIFLEVIGQ